VKRFRYLEERGIPFRFAGASLKLQQPRDFSSCSRSHDLRLMAANPRDDRDAFSCPKATRATRAFTRGQGISILKYQRRKEERSEPGCECNFDKPPSNLVVLALTNRSGAIRTYEHDNLSCDRSLFSGEASSAATEHSPSPNLLSTSPAVPPSLPPSPARGGESRG
jgi:hypothetical protein